MSDLLTSNPQPGAAKLLGATLTPLDSANIAATLDWLFDGAPAPPSVERLADMAVTAVLQCCDSLVWGLNAGGIWHWASDADPDDIRRPERITLLEARIFTAEQEILLWRSGDFDQMTFAGRLLRDAAIPPADELHRPIVRCYPFDSVRDEEEPLQAGFTLRKTLGGKILVAPTGNGVRVLHYLQECAQTGTLRIAASRLVEIVTTCGSEGEVS